MGTETTEAELMGPRGGKGYVAMLSDKAGTSTLIASGGKC